MNNDHLIYRDNVWDYKSFGFKVAEILEFTSNLDSHEVMRQYIKESLNHNFHMSIVRVKQVESLKRKILVNNSFEMVETSYSIFCNRSKLQNLSMLNNKKIHIRKDCSLTELQNLSESIFNHGRFAEDLYVDRKKSNLRYRNWCCDLYYGNKDRSFLFYKNKLIGFMFYEREENSAKLVLGGMDLNYSHLAHYFWSKVFASLPEKTMIETMISASNIGIVNLYFHFGFKIRDCVCGYRRFNVKRC